MNNFIKNIIEEEFKSKSQQKYFYAKANDKNLPKKERNKWGKWAKEFSSKTDFKKLPDNKKDVDEIVDELGIVQTEKKPPNFNTKNVTQKKTTDDVIKATGAGSVYGKFGVQNYTRRWGEILEVELGQNLGAEETIEKDLSFDKAYKYFTKKLGLDKEQALEKMKNLGYNEKLPKDKIIMIENPKKFIEEYIDELITNKYKSNDILEKDNVEDEEINPIILKQINSLKKSIKTHGLKKDQILKLLNKDE